MMLIPLDYRSEGVLTAHERIWRSVRPDWIWPARHPYTSEYAWACDRLMERVMRPARVMDAGGGGGSMQHFLAETFGECWNVDVTPRHLHTSLAPSFLVTSDLERIEGLQPASFDGILSASALEHNPWPKFLRVVRNLLELIKPGGPLVATVPAFERRAYYPTGGWPGAGQEAWPECLLFDRDSIMELADAVADIAVLEEPIIQPPEEYREQWREMHADMMANSPEGSRYPYLSLGFVLRRRSA